MHLLAATGLLQNSEVGTIIQSLVDVPKDLKFQRHDGNTITFPNGANIRPCLAEFFLVSPLKFEPFKSGLLSLIHFFTQVCFTN